MNPIKIAALVYLIFYYGMLVGYRSFLLYRRTGINPIKKITREGVTGFVENVFGVCFVLISVIVLNYVFIEKNYEFYLVPIPYLEQEILGFIGIPIALIGLLFAFIAQLQMGDSWRLGVNEKLEKTELITKGLYQYSRNPVYFGLLISYIGFFLMMPNALSFCFLVLSYFALEIKIRLEEDHLEKNHAAVFFAYKKKVRRWIG